jgi:hypothetical protein
MRTTLIIDDDVMAVARDLARQEHKSVSAVFSELARGGYKARRSPDASGTGSARPSRGFGMLPDRGVVVTNDQVNALRDELGI